MGHEASRVRCQYYLREGFVEDIKVKGGSAVMRSGICFWMQDWHEPSSMMQRGSVQAVFSDVTFFCFQDGFDYRKAEIRESYA